MEDKLRLHVIVICMNVSSPKGWPASSCWLEDMSMREHDVVRTLRLITIMPSSNQTQASVLNMHHNHSPIRRLKCEPMQGVCAQRWL